MKNTILYIDDEKENLESFQLAFWSKYNLLLAESTKEGENLLKDSNVKIIITDQKMAGETGLQFIDRIKHQYPDILFIVLTAYAELDIVLDAINTGVYQFIQKPWDQKEMHQVISNAIDKYDLQKQNKELLIELKKKNEELKNSNDELLSLARQYRERKVKSEANENLLNAVFRNLPLIIMLVDSERNIVKINNEGIDISGKQLEELIGKGGGDALNCIHALGNPKGCGHSDSCQSCLIRSTVSNSLKYKTDYHKVEAKLTVAKNGMEEERKVLVSTAFINGREPLVLVSLDDVTNNKEIIALK
jgi:FixJ family two-component response regulator